MIYRGYENLKLDENELSKFYNGEFKEEFLENQYIKLIDDKGETFDIYKYRDGNFLKISYPTIESEYIEKLRPRNPEQYCAMDLLKDKDIPIKLITGSFGTGKSLMCIAAALSAVQKGEFDKIVFVRNNVQVRNTGQLGALPGEVYDKTLPYLMPFADHCGGIDGVQRLIGEGKLEVIPLGFLRGRSIRNAILYSMESENLTKQHIQLIMGRVDEGSQLWMDGDIKQRDKDIFCDSRGLEVMVERLKGNKNFGYVHLLKSERSEVAALADLLD